MHTSNEIDSLRGVTNWQGSLPGLHLNGRFRQRLRPSFGGPMPIECQRMSAVVSTYVPGKGFAVGADGLRAEGTGRVVTENARKIFLIESAGLRLIHAWVGASSLWLRERRFSFVDECATIGNELALSKPESIENYVNAFAVKMYKKLQTICLPDGRLADSPDVLPLEEIARVLIVGYYDGKPYRTGVTFSHKHLRLQTPFMDELIESPDSFNIFSGSAVILNQLQPIMAPESLEEAAELIRKYIQACVDNRNNYADCATFGGQVHVATITPERFEWYIPPSEPGDITFPA
jgi:hypothetical protein